MIAPTARFHGYIAALRLNTQSLVLKILILGTYFFLFDLSYLKRLNGFRFYNKTHFSGLETHILNSYTNAVVQVMHYVPPIRRLAKAHILIDCPREHCLFCELGFVFRMLEDARGTNCQASNFCKTVGVLAQGFPVAVLSCHFLTHFLIASNAIELIDYGREAAGVNYAQKIQAFHRFLVDHLSSEGNAFPHNPSLLPRIFHSQSPSPTPISQLIGVDGKNIITCSHCKDVREKDSLIHVIDLIYSRKVSEDIILLNAYLLRVYPAEKRTTAYRFCFYLAELSFPNDGSQSDMSKLQAV